MIKKVATFFNFVVYVKEVDNEKLKTFGKLVATLWKTFSYLSKDARTTATVFDLHLENTIKYDERTRCRKRTAINTVIENVNLPLIVTIESFWASSINREKLHIFFIDWLLKSSKDDKPAYLGGLVPRN